MELDSKPSRMAMLNISERCHAEDKMNTPPSPTIDHDCARKPSKSPRNRKLNSVQPGCRVVTLSQPLRGAVEGSDRFVAVCFDPVPLISARRCTSLHRPWFFRRVFGGFLGMPTQQQDSVDLFSHLPEDKVVRQLAARHPCRHIGVHICTCAVVLSGRQPVPCFVQFVLGQCQLP